MKNFFMKLFRILPLLAVTLSSLAISPKAEALTLLSTQTVGFTNQTTELPGTPVLTLNKYTGPGILTQVDFTFNAALRSSGTVTNTAAQAQNFDVDLLVSRFRLTALTGAPGALLVNPNYELFTANTLIGSQTYTNLAPNSPAAFGPYTINSTPSAPSFTGINLLGFNGPGTFSFAPTTRIATSFFGGGGNTSANINTFADASVTVNYYTSDVPFDIPYGSTIPVIGSIVALGAMRKVKKTIALKTPCA
jgi:hypothetical protein